MNIELLEQIIKHIEEEPRRFDMGEWIIKWSKNFKDDPHCPPCGTTACIAGWAVILSGIEPESPYNARWWLEKGRALLDLSYYQAEKLFLSGCWPEPFKKQYTYAETGQERAQVAIERIRFFILTDGFDTMP